MFRSRALAIAEAPQRWPALIWAAGPALVVIGITTHGLWAQAPWERVALALGLVLTSAALAWPAVRWLHWRWASALVAVWSGALLLFAGPRPVLAVALLAIAAMATGLRWVPAGLPGRAAIAAIVGYAAIAGVTGWLLRLPIHHAPMWLIALAALVAIGRKALVAELRASAGAWRVAAAEHPRALAWGVMLLGLASTGAWLPTMQMDDLTYHLNLPAQLALHAHYEAAPQHGIWAFAPWLGDIGQGIAWLIAGQEARGALNAFWLIGAACALGSCARALGATPLERNAAIALFASFPPLVWLTAGMQTELPAMAVLFALCSVLAYRDGDGPRLMAATLLLAALAALKPVHALSALPLLAWAGTRGLQWPGTRHGLAALAAGLLIAGSSYANAWWYTGNPVLPLFNAVFQSPFHPPENMSDGRWHAGLGLDLPWQLTFASSRYVEAWDGGTGFVLIGLAGAWLLALGRGATRGFALAATGVALLPLLPMQYARYAYPGIALLIVACLPGSRAQVGDRAWRWGIVALCALNLAFQANAGWTHHSAALKRTLRATGDASVVLPHYVAERTLIAGLPDDGGIVLATDPKRGHIAELGGRGRLMSLHAPALSAARLAADADPSGDAWRRVLADTDARWILITEAEASPALRAGLDASNAVHVRSLNGIALWRRGQE
ncbi:hypothetical protein ABE488_04645 [Luteimonas sp. TWI662]|uniref:hypothetical protein n=1 Tax=Luteimonas sp. TWI662 TaxID=3136789 RepID=UPI00320A2B08